MPERNNNHTHEKLVFKSKIFVLVSLIILIVSIALQSNTSFGHSGQASPFGFLSFFTNNQQINPRGGMAQQYSAPPNITEPAPPEKFPGITCKNSGCDIGTSTPPIVIKNSSLLDWDGTWPESMKILFELSIAKKQALTTWLNSKCLDPNCEKIATGPSVSIKLEPKNPNIGSCTVQSTRSFVFTSQHSAATCEEAKAKVFKDIGNQMYNIPDPCSSCGYKWDLSKIDISCTEQPPDSGNFVAKGTLNAKVSCTDKSSTDEYNGLIEWEACYCCKAVPPPAEPKNDAGIDPFSSPTQNQPSLTPTNPGATAL